MQGSRKHFSSHHAVDVVAALSPTMAACCARIPIRYPGRDDFLVVSAGGQGGAAQVEAAGGRAATAQARSVLGRLSAGGHHAAQ